MNEAIEKIILVDENDLEIGTIEKLEGHQKGILHRAVSVFIINSDGKWILQQRAFHKYHSKGLWTNTCCTHPRPEESNIDAAKRRLKEEMGIDCNLTKLFSFIYNEKVDENLTENELDHVFLGISNATPVINPEEVNDWKTIEFEFLKQDIEKNPENYTVWFKKIYSAVNAFINDRLNKNE